MRIRLGEDYAWWDLRLVRVTLSIGLRLVRVTLGED